MNRKIVSLIATIAVGAASPAAIAFAQSPASPAPAQTRAAAGPTLSSSAVGIQRTPLTTSKPAAPADARLGAGRNVALMVVGGAALIIGAVIGGTAGVLIAVAGAAVGLFGLYYFVQ